MKRHVLFVDDDKQVLDAYRRMLHGQRKQWEASFAESVDKALEIAENHLPDAVITDLKMERRDGFDLIRALKASERLRDVPVTIVTGAGEHALKRQALDEGATDLLAKPVTPEELMARIRNMLQIKAYQDEIKAHNEMLEHKVRQRTRELENSHLDIIWRLAKAGEYRDETTGYHVVRVGWCSRILARELKCPDTFCERIFVTSPLHDIGKIGIPDGILLKKGCLTDLERGMMEKHCEIGAMILREQPRLFYSMKAEKRGNEEHREMGVSNPLLKMAAEIAESHHERWDGKGYPRRLAGEEIPLEARIVSLADIYDALTSERPYKKAYPEAKALQMMEEMRGCRFDPAVFDAFMGVSDAFRAVRLRLSDGNGFAFIDPTCGVEGGGRV
jgi:response regulator RpfG family c-di-GMP phosphodiesterase